MTRHSVPQLKRQLRGYFFSQNAEDTAALTPEPAPEAPSAPETPRKLDRRQFIGFS